MRAGVPTVQGSRQVSQQFFSQLEHYSGPLPHPKILQEFEALLPGSASRIIRNFEVESDHRRLMESDESEAARGFFSRQLHYRDRGQKMGFLIVLAGFGISALAFYLKQPVGGSIITAVDLVALVALFITGKGPRVLTQPAEQPPPKG